MNQFLVGYVSVPTQLAIGNTAGTFPAPSVRIFDLAISSTAGTLTIYAGSDTTGTPVLHLHGARDTYLHSDMGWLFPASKGCWAYATGGTGSVNYIHVF